MALRPILALTVATGLAACVPDETISGFAPDGALWQLEILNGAAYPARATLAFPAPGEVRGSGPCNSFVARQGVPYPWIEIKEIASTKTACPGLEHEQMFFEALRRVSLAEVAGNTMILSTEDGDEMVFVRAD